MLPNPKKKAHNCIGAAIILSVTGFVLTIVHTPLAPLAPPVSFSAIPIIVMGACAFAKAKGYHWSLGFLILTTIPGLLVLMLLKDKHPEEGPEIQKPKRLRTKGVIDSDVIDV